MATIDVKCPACGTIDTVKFGLSATNKQRYRCNNTNCKRKTFILNYTDKGRLPDVKDKIIKMAMNGSGIRNTARVLGISATTVISELKKRAEFRHRQ